MVSQFRASCRALPSLALLPLLWPASLRAAPHEDPLADRGDCTITGQVTPALETPLQSDSFETVARLTGAALPVRVVQLPHVPSTLARIVTHPEDNGGFRLTARASVRNLGLRAKTAIEVVPGVLRLVAGTALDAAAVAGQTLYVEKHLSFDFHQTIVARATCSQLGFSVTASRQPQLPVAARAYRLDAETLRLFFEPTAQPEHSLGLTRAPAAKGLLVFGTTERPGWLHVYYDGEISIEGWVSPDSLVALAPGELEDRAPRSLTRRSAPQMRFDDTTRLAQAKATIPIRISASESGPVIGHIPDAAEYYVLEVVAGWVSVLPKALDVLPPMNKSFWIRATDGQL